MYASQTKRLCVRGAATSDESSVQHHSTSSESVVAAASNPSTAPTPIVPYQQQHSPASDQQTYPNQAALQQPSSSSHPITAVDRFGTTVASATVISNSAAAAAAAAPVTPRMTANDVAGDNRQSALNKNATPRISLIASETTPTPPSQNTNHTMRQGAGPVNGYQQCPNCTIAPDDYLCSGNECDLIDGLACATVEEVQLRNILSLRNLITACNRKKETLTNCEAFYTIVGKFDDEKTSSAIKTQLALLLCSIAKGGEQTVKKLIDHNVDEKIFRIIIETEDATLIEAGLRCLRSMMSWPRVSRTWIIYENAIILKQRPHNGPDNSPSSSFSGYSSGVANLEKLIYFCQNSDSIVIHECVADLFALTCLRSKDQMMIYKASPFPCIIRLLESDSRRVVISTLCWLNRLCLKNPMVSAEILRAKFKDGTPLLGRLTKMMNQDECLELQFLAAQCFVHTYRALGKNDLKGDPRVHNNVLPTLVRMVHRDKPPHFRAKAAGCITYLIEHDIALQNTASICDRLIESLANMLSYEPNKLSEETCGTYNQPKSMEQSNAFWRLLTSSSYPYVRNTADHKNPDLSRDNTHVLCLEMKRAAFLALASLGSNLEPIRKKIFNTCSVMQYMVRNLNEGDTKTLMAVLSCLLSLSRSVQQLRTSFAESSVYSALKNLLGTSSHDVLVLVLAVLCNISLDFSPGKQHFLDAKTLNSFCNMAKSEEPFLRLHGMWILMNMVYQAKDINLKYLVLNSLGIDYTLELLKTDNDDELVMKTLGFLRNLLSQRPHIDALMSQYGSKFMEGLTYVIEKKCSSRLKEQAVCVLTNIADGTDTRDLVAYNQVVIKYLAKTLDDEQAGDLRLAAICCLTNLVQKEHPGSYTRKEILNKFGFEEKMKSLLDSEDPILADRARTAYLQCLECLEDKRLAKYVIIECPDDSHLDSYDLH